MVNHSDNLDTSFEVSIRRDLCRLARFGANIADAHSCFIFLPEKILSSEATSLGGFVNRSEPYLEIAGYHSLSREILGSCRLSCSAGLIGWVAKNRRAIHVSPFERDSRTLGTYSADQQLKSFIGIPLNIPAGCGGEHEISGVIACDSRKAFAFSKLQGKLLEDLSHEITNALRLNTRNNPSSSGSGNWQDFLRDTIKLSEAIGKDSLEILRLRLRNFEDLELELGTAECLKLVQQLCKLIKQALPANHPLFILPNGDIVIALDTMTSSFYENRVAAVCSRLGESGIRPPDLIFSRRSVRDRRYRNATLERLITETAVFESAVRQKQGELYEFRRA